MTRICFLEACVQIEYARKKSNVSPNTDVSKLAFVSKRGRFAAYVCGSRRVWMPTSSRSREGSIPK